MADFPDTVWTIGVGLHPHIGPVASMQFGPVGAILLGLQDAFDHLVLWRGIERKLAEKMRASLERFYRRDWKKVPGA